MLHALAGVHHVDTLTLDAWSPRDTNAFYGTAIPETITQHVASLPWAWLGTLPEHRGARLRMCAVLREARRLADRFDLSISADNYAPFAKPGIQYVHFPADLDPQPTRLAPIVHVYFRFCDRVLQGSWRDAANNITLANSQWTANGLIELGEMAAPILLYPPVIDPGEGLPWDQRDDVFLSIGRFHGSKKIETAMAIVERVRARIMPHARLLIIGSPVDPEYSARIHRLAEETGRWIEFREDLSRAELNALMGRCRYGLQAMEFEHFGMATAEMTRAGCLVFAHRSGGSPEVLNNEDALLWSDPEEVPAKVEHLDVEGLRARLRVHARTFSTGRFVERFREIVATSAAGTRDR